jgi:hypothetical protein
MRVLSLHPRVAEQIRELILDASRDGRCLPSAHPVRDILAVQFGIWFRRAQVLRVVGR